MDHGADLVKRRLLLVHAHPDDESLYTGGTIARYAADGVEVHLVTCTLGEEGEVIPSDLQLLDVEHADQLGGYRYGELAAACEQLGVQQQWYLGGVGRWRDSGMAGSPAADKARAFIRGDLAEQTAQLRAVIDKVRPQVVVCYDADGAYGHPDHIRSHLVARRAAAGVERVFHVVSPQTPFRKALEALAVSEHQPFTVPALDEVPTVPDDRVHTVIDIAGVQDRKLAALREHATQVAVDGSVYALSNGIAVPNPDAEYFELASGPSDGAGDDLFGGLR